jgi:hypothetical protein
LFQQTRSQSQNQSRSRARKSPLLRNSSLLEVKLPTGVVEEIEIEAVDAGGAARVSPRVELNLKGKGADYRTPSGQTRSQLRSLHAPRGPRLQRSQLRLNKPSLRLRPRLSPDQPRRLSRLMKRKGRKQLAMALKLNEYRLSVEIEALLEEYGR